MGRKVIWSKASSRDLAEVLEYLDNNWSSAVTKSFNAQLRHQIEIIVAFPEIGESFLDDTLGTKDFDYKTQCPVL